jgi:hypothetical protein
MRGNTGIAILGPRDRGRQRAGGGEDNTDSGPVASNGKEKSRASAQKQKKKEGNTLIGGGGQWRSNPLMPVKEAAKASEMCG